MFVGGGGREKGTLFVPKYAAFAHCYNSPQSPISFWGKMQKEERVSDGLQYLILVKHWWPMFVPAIISMPYDHTVLYYYSYYHYCPDQISFKIHKSASDFLTLISVNDFSLFFQNLFHFNWIPSLNVRCWKEHLSYTVSTYRKCMYVALGDSHQWTN